MSSLRFIVTGTGRCGTVFFAKMLTSAGLNCGHESIFDYSADDIVIDRLLNFNNINLSICSTMNNLIDREKEDDWLDVSKIIADSSYLAAPYLNHPLIRDTPVIHIFRDPLEVISSYVLDFNYFKNKKPDDDNPYNEKGWENKIYRTIPELSLLESQIERACWFYIRWNQLISDSCKFRKYLLVDIENIDYNKLFNFLDIEIHKESLYSNQKSNTNRKRKKNLELSEIPSYLRRILYKQQNLKIF